MLKIGNYLLLEKEGNTVTLSMTPELQDDVGTVGFIEFTEADTIAKDDPIAHIEASKTVLEITSPVAGKLLSVNEQAIKEPSLLNSANKEKNWLVKLIDINEEDFQQLQAAE